MAAGLAGETVDHRQAEARALADRLVVKNGSKALASTLALMPQPLSITLSVT